MTLQRQFGFWIGAFVAAILFLYVFSDILLPFVAGMALAYLLDPVADRLETVLKSRGLATLVILFGFVLVLVFFVFVAVPVLASQLAAFVERGPDYAKRVQDLIHQFSQGRLSELLGMSRETLQARIGEYAGEAAKWIGRILSSLWSGGQAVLSVLSLFVITPVVAFYLLYDWDRMIEQVDDWLPRPHAETIRGLFAEMDQVVSAFVRGQISVCIILGLFYGVALSLIGLNFGLLIGFGAGMISFVPYVGSGLGLVVAGGVALVQFWPEFVWIFAVLLVFVVGQLIEGYVLQPNLIGKSVGLHPVWLMFALFAFGSLFGFVGLLIAVPAAASIGVLFRFGLKQYQASAFYRGTAGRP